MAKDIVVNEIERCRPWIEAALKYTGGTHEFEDIVDGIRSSRMQLWPSEGVHCDRDCDIPKKESVKYVFSWWRFRSDIRYE